MIRPGGVSVAFVLNLQPGQIALLEADDFGLAGATEPLAVTGVIADGERQGVVIVGISPSELGEGSNVMASVFAPEALYRIRAGIHWIGPDRLALDPIQDVERIQRRRWPRHELHLDVTLAPVTTDGEPASAGAAEVRGQTVDIGMGGLRVETIDPLPACDTITVTLMLPDGAPLLARATVVACDTREDGFEYRIAFDQLDDLDLTNLTALLDPHAAAADIRRKAATGRARGR